MTNTKLSAKKKDIVNIANNITCDSVQFKTVSTNVDSDVSCVEMTCDDVIESGPGPPKTVFADSELGERFIEPNCDIFQGVNYPSGEVRDGPVRGRDCAEMICDDNRCTTASHSGTDPTDVYTSRSSVKLTCDSDIGVTVQYDEGHDAPDVSGSYADMTCRETEVAGIQSRTDPPDVYTPTELTFDSVSGVTLQSNEVQTIPNQVEFYPVLRCCVKMCKEEVFIACPLCLICYDHKDTNCNDHNGREYVIFVDDNGNEFQVEVESDGSGNNDALYKDCSQDVSDNDHTVTVGLDSVPRRSNPWTWKRNVAKNCRNGGKQYTSCNGDI